MDRPALLRWFDAHRRDLPWRRTADPYAKWISEVMLQQTRVDTVVPYYERFLARFPTVHALAKADPEEVRSLWSGLGYYRRAQQMLQAAATVVRDHDGRLPADGAALRALPGFGPYMTGAVASMAFDLPLPAVDGNVTRVLSRLHAVEGPSDRAAHRHRIHQLATQWAQREPGRVNEALIELGATVCTPRRPRCGQCPLEATCSGKDRPEQLPPPKPRKAPQIWPGRAYRAVDREGHIFLERRGPTGLFADLWCVPIRSADEAAPEWSEPWVWHSTGRIQHVLTHRRLDLEVWTTEARFDGGPNTAWVRAVDLPNWGTPSLVGKVLKADLPPLFRPSPSDGG